MSDTSAQLTHTITIERDFVTGGVSVKWDDLAYSEILGLLEFAKMLAIKEYLNDPNA